MPRHPVPLVLERSIAVGPAAYVVVVVVHCLSVAEGVSGGDGGRGAKKPVVPSFHAATELLVEPAVADVRVQDAAARLAAVESLPTARLVPVSGAAERAGVDELVFAEDAVGSLHRGRAGGWVLRGTERSVESAIERCDVTASAAASEPAVGWGAHWCMKNF